MEKSIVVPAPSAGRAAPAKKKLMPYHPNATRNRPKHAVRNPACLVDRVLSTRDNHAAPHAFVETLIRADA